MCVRARVSHWKIVRMSSSVRCRKKLVLWPLPLHGFARWLLIDVVFFFVQTTHRKVWNARKRKWRHATTPRHRDTWVSFHVWHAFRFEAFSDLLSFASSSLAALSQAYPLQVWFVLFLAAVSVVDRHQQTKKFLQTDFFNVVISSSVWVYLDIFLGILMDKLHEQKCALFEGSTSQRDRPKTCRKNRISFMNSHGNSEKNSTERLK